MQFHNASIDTTTLPSVAAAEWKPIERSYLKVLRIQWVITAVIMLLAAGFMSFIFESLLYSLLLIAGAVVLLAIYFLVQERAFPFKAYCLRENDIMYRSGWIIRTIAVCPFNRIQHCNVRTGPLERNYRLASVTVYTAGAGSDLKIPGLPEETAGAIREFIMKKIALDEQQPG
jgi:membrane protein YdbS with pleckstrin-like domain